MAGERIISQHATVTARLQQVVAEAVRRAWRTVPDVSDQSAELWLARIVPMVAGAQQQASTLTATYLAALMSEMTGEPVDPMPIDPAVVTGAAARSGTDPAVVYRRPIVEARSLLAAGVAGADALRRSEVRAVQLVATDVQLARTHTARQVISGDSRIVGYSRVLTGSESCGLCVVATTQRYRTGDLLPIHPGCDCAVAPIIGTEDPGRVINRPLLDQVHENVASRFGADAVDLAAGSDIFDQSHPYRQLVTVYDHGEYGPTLAKSGQHQLTSAAAEARSSIDPQ